MALGLSGLASGFDWQSLIDQLIQVSRAPETRMRTQQNTLAQQKAAYGSISSQLSTVLSRVKTLNDPDLFGSRLTESSDSTTGSAAASPGAAVGSYNFEFTQMASPSRYRGAANVGKALSTTNDVSGLALSSAGFSSSVTAGTFTVNGQSVTVASSDTLQQVFDRIQTATSGVVSASYDAATDRIRLTSSGEIVLGSVADTSNFLQVARLHNNGSGDVTSASALGGVKLSSALASANLNTTLFDGGSGAGEFTVNGVSIAFNAGTDTVKDVLDRINNSDAGVTASYDSSTDRFSITNHSTGDIGIALNDVTGNFLAATGLTGGSLERGKNLVYTVNGSDPLTSRSNTITEDSSGLTGLSVEALQKGTVTITVSQDKSKIKSAIKDFITEYNKAQSLIDTQSASSTDAKGKVTAGILAGDSTISELATKLRSLSFTPASGSGSIRSLADLGVDSNGQDNTLTLSDETKLDAALANHLEAVKDLFVNETDGLAVTLSEYLDTVTGESGTLATKQDSFTKQSGEIDNQIAALERRLANEQERLTASFVAMETAQGKIKQQLQYLQQRFGAAG